MGKKNKIMPCKKCGSTNIHLYDCGYSSFNCGGGECLGCGRKSGSQTLNWNPSNKTLIRVWNNGQKLTALEKANARIAKLEASIKAGGTE